ncbi:Major facilitator superfamily [Macrophomina phaseolina MS6]|uniref:Major facilitator superfamily n=1 Tax=Macrophomina phaseolina (strain MS6) TaxID=1126212 RepID=K2RRF1_MACPH|nr:Major facilitator superfamily [Macrophomina phaseolina MS6]
MELVVLLCAFKHEDASRYRLANSTGRAPNKSGLKAVLTHLATWASAAFFLAYVGTETAISGWVVSFMTRARHATLSAASLASSGFWTGMAVGRVALGTVTDRLGVRLATFIYLLCGMSIEILYIAFKSQAASLVSLTFLGLFMGPLFPSGVVLLTRLLPREDHITAVSLVASVGQVGGALLPFGIGAVVQGLGIGVFQYAIVVLSFLAMVMWIAFSRIRPTRAITPPEGRDEGEINT